MTLKTVKKILVSGNTREITKLWDQLNKAECEKNSGLPKRRNDDNKIWARLAALFLGFVGLAIFTSLSQSKDICPYCKKPIKKGAKFCLNCQNRLDLS
jgi:hypothetical protein